VKVRIGFGLGTTTGMHDPSRFADLVDALEELRFDSLWLSERLSGDAPDPLVALTFAAGRTTRLKLGTSVIVVPGRNPVVLAKQMATLDWVSGGRFLPAVGLGAPIPREHQAFGIERTDRAPWFDEALPLMRRLWTEDEVSHQGERFTLDRFTLLPHPIQQPIEVWLGGRAPGELRRVGRLGDGWLASFVTVDDVATGWDAITASATAHDRTIDPEHLGVLVPYSNGPLPDSVAQFLTRRAPGADPVDPADVIPVGLRGLRTHLEALIGVGASKFVVLPLPSGQPEADDLPAELTRIRDGLFDLQT